MRKFLSFVAIASLSVCAFAQEATLNVASEQTVTSQPTAVEPAPVADQTVMVMAASPCCNGMYTSTQAAGCGCATAAPACGTCDSCCETSKRRGVFTRLRSRGNNDCCQAAPVCNTCNTCDTCNTCCDSNRGLLARVGNRNNNCCQTASTCSTCSTCATAACSTCATATYTSAPVAAPVAAPVQDCGCSTPVNSCCQPAASDCCDSGRTRILGSKPVRTRLMSRRGNNCGC